MLRSSLVALASLLATSLARATDTEVAPASPDFRPVLYRPWLPGESVPAPYEAPEVPAAELVPGPDFARRPYQASAGVAALPLECLASRRACGSNAEFVSLAWRATPHFAWVLAAERTQLVVGDRYYLALGARVFAYERGAVDPYLELTLGGEAATEAEGIALAGEVVFGVGITLVEQLTLTPTLELRHSEHRLGVCRSALAACDPWSRERTYWVAFGLSIAAAWGPRH